MGAMYNDKGFSVITKKVMFALFFFIILYVVGIVVYYFTEGWDYLDSVYFMTVTFTTIGYGDIVPKTKLGKLFTVIIIWAGISIALYLLYSFTYYRERIVDRKLAGTIKGIKKMVKASNQSRVKRKVYRIKADKK